MLLQLILIATLLTSSSLCSPTGAPRHHGGRYGHEAAANGIVSLDYATYQGTPLTAGVTQWLGIRFAAPPLGDLRFRAPADPPRVAGVQNATEFQPLCLGQGQNTSTGAYSEDCLYINVFAPSNVTKASKLPVWLYIQGGGYLSNSNPNYNGTEVAQKGDVVFVNFNYRVSSLGFLASEEVRNNGDLNAGLLDQRKAMEWVQMYIHKFGGDPDHVVIHGTSAGAGSVAIHLTAYNARNDNLFIGAVAQSPFFPLRPLRVNDTGCANATDALACLRAAPITAIETGNAASPYPGQPYAPDFYWSATIDGELLPGPTIQLIQEGKVIPVPLMVGDETNEGTDFAGNASSAAEVSTFFSANCPRLPASALAEINVLYPLMAALPMHAAYFPSAAAAYGEATFVCGGLALSQALSTATAGRSWNYRWDVTDAANIAAGLGVPHTFDMPAILGADLSGVPTPSSGAYTYTTYNAPVVPVLMDYYISFIRDLDPNVEKDATAPNWGEVYDGKGGEQRLLLDVNATVMEAVPADQLQRCAFWDGLVGYTQE